MSSFLEYELEDGSTILIQIDAKTSQYSGTRSGGGSVVMKAGKKFSEALDSILKQANEIKAKLVELQADEVEVKFGLTAEMDAGNFAIGKIGIEANYEVTLKWDNKKLKEKVVNPQNNE